MRKVAPVKFDLQSFLQGRKEVILNAYSDKIEAEINKDAEILSKFYESGLDADTFAVRNSYSPRGFRLLLARYDLPTKPLESDQYENLERRTRRQRKELFACKSNCLASRIVNEIIDDG